MTGRGGLRAAAPGLRLVAVGLGLAACNTPTPSLQLAFAGPPRQECVSTDCAMVPMNCNTVMSVKIIDPDDRDHLPYSQCTKVPVGDHTMCSLGSVDLLPVKLPVRDLEVQVALWPATMIPADPLRPGELDCPDVEFSAVGFPKEQAPTPALGGRAFYHPGDATVVVTLGCTNLAAINDSCVTSNLITVTSTVDDFDTMLPVTNQSGVASRLRVSVGEPVSVDGPFMLPTDNLRALNAVSDTGGLPTWQDDVDLTFNNYTCIDVLENLGQTTATLRCRPMSSDSHLELSGVWLKKNVLDDILKALAQSPLPPMFPDEGLTVGIVVDESSIPVRGIHVRSTAGSVEYLTDKGIGGIATSSSGVFVSRDAPFETRFIADGTDNRPEVTAIGGRVVGRVTVVVLQLGGP